MSVDHTTGHTYDREIGVDDVRERLSNRIPSPPTFDRPERWTFTKAWKRAQQEAAWISLTADPSQWTVILGDGAPHTVTFALLDGELIAECDCGAYQHHYNGTWGPHIAVLWLWWTNPGRGDRRFSLPVTDLDTGRRYHSPPAWLRIDHEARQLPNRHDARVDGGTER